MATNKFFDESREQSVVKAEIVEKYFDAWAGIITGAQSTFKSDLRIAYIDLFAGPGRYKDGAISTPIRVLKKAIENNKYANTLVTVFNDKDKDNAQTLQEAINELPNIGTLKYKPEVWNEEVGDRIAAEFSKTKNIPILAFIDPWGYKGLSLKLVDAFLKDWGCDCIFFFNYARINAGLSNPLVREHMAALFGQEQAEDLSLQLEPMTPHKREATIVNALALALKSFGNRYVLPFCFKNQTGKRTTHHLIFVSKKFKGYDVMKSIMANVSSEEFQGVPSFTFSPAVDRQQQFLFELNRPLDDLEAMLLSAYAGMTKTMHEIYVEHSVDRQYISKNYKDILIQLEKSGKVSTSGRKSSRGFADNIQVTFPKIR